MYIEEGNLHSDITDLCYWCKYDGICWVQHNIHNCLKLVPSCVDAEMDITQCKEFNKAKGDNVDD